MATTHNCSPRTRDNNCPTKESLNQGNFEQIFTKTTNQKLFQHAATRGANLDLKSEWEKKQKKHSDNNKNRDIKHHYI